MVRRIARAVIFFFRTITRQTPSNTFLRTFVVRKPPSLLPTPASAPHRQLLNYLKAKSDPPKRLSGSMVGREGVAAAAEPRHAAGRDHLHGMIWRVQLNGPNASGPWGALVPGATVIFSHSSGKVLPCTTTRWKFGTL